MILIRLYKLITFRNKTSRHYREKIKDYDKKNNSILYNLLIMISFLYINKF